MTWYRYRVGRRRVALKWKWRWNKIGQWLGQWTVAEKGVINVDVVAIFCPVEGPIMDCYRSLIELAPAVIPRTVGALSFLLKSFLVDQNSDDIFRSQGNLASAPPHPPILILWNQWFSFPMTCGRCWYFLIVYIHNIRGVLVINIVRIFLVHVTTVRTGSNPFSKNN